MNGQLAASGYLGANVRVQDQQYTPVTSPAVAQDEIYVNSQPEQSDSTYDDPSKPSKPSDQLYVQDEMYVNPEMTGGEVYEEMDRKDPPDNQVTEMYVIPAAMIKDSEQGDMYVIPEKPKSQTEDQLYVNPELNNEESVYDDTTVLLDHDDRGYEKMKSGVSINDINAEYTYAVQEDKKASEAELYEVPDSEGYENMGRDMPKPPQGDKGEDGYLTLERNPQESFHESQIYSSVQ